MLHIRNLVTLVSLNLFLVYAAADTAETATQVATNNIPTCSENDANINDCLLKVLQELIPRSKNAIPELNIPIMDPFVINRTSYVFSHPLLEGKLAVRNVKIHGLSTTKIKRVQYKREGNEVSLKSEFFVPKIFVEGFYKAKIRFNRANILSRGPFNITLTNINGSDEGSAELYKQNGHVYMHYKTYNINPTVGNMHINAEGLMPDPLLNQAILEFMNQNWRSIYKTIIPETRAAWEPEFIKLANEYFSHLPFDAVLKT